MRLINNKPGPFVGIFNQYQLDQVTQRLRIMLRDWLKFTRQNYHQTVTEKTDKGSHTDDIKSMK